MTRQVSKFCNNNYYQLIYNHLRQDVYHQWSLRPKRLIFVALCNDLIDYFIVCIEHQCNTMRAFFKKQLNVWQLTRQRSFYEELSFQHYLQHYSETKRTTEIQSCLQVHRPVCCGKMSSVAIKSQCYQEIAFRPVSNRHLVSPVALIVKITNHD